MPNKNPFPVLPTTPPTETTVSEPNGRDEVDRVSRLKPLDEWPQSTP